MARRFFGTNGVRFRPGIDYGIDFVIEMAEAIGTYYSRGPVLLGYDGRFSSPSLAKAAASGLMSVGIEVAEAALLPTPALQYSTPKLGYRGAVMITASHNPPEYNGIKVMGSNGVEISRQDESVVESIYLERKQARKDWRGLGEFSEERRALRAYIGGVLSQVDRELIAERGFSVVLDLGNGAQCVAAPYILEGLGCKVFTINGHIDGNFPGRGAEPLPEKLEALSKGVLAFKADLGVAYDGDGDRAIFCDERGRVFEGDKSSTLIAGHLLRAGRGSTIVTTVSSSQLIDHVSQEYGGKVLRTRVGSVDVSWRMIETDAIFGFEENGGCFYGPHIPVRDGAMATALMLEALAKAREPLSGLLSKLPRCFQKKTKVKCPDVMKGKVMKVIEEEAKGRVEKVDGVKLWLDAQTWVLARPSGTEPLIRIYAESDDEDRLNAILARFQRIVEGVLKG